MVYTVEVESELRDLLQEELTDPNRDRRSQNRDFVFTDAPDTHSEHPIVLISLADNQKDRLSIGDTASFHRHRIQVTVNLGKRNSFEVNGGVRRSKGYVKNFLIERIDEIVQDNQDRFRDLGDDIYSLLPDSSNSSIRQGTSSVTGDYILRRVNE